MKPVFLFDIDGVLVQPYGYRAAVQATTAQFLGGWGLGQGWVPNEDDIAWLEAHRISSEWDMVPLFLAAALEHLRAEGATALLPDGLHTGQPLRRWFLPPAPVYSELIQPLTGHLRLGEYPSETALRITACNPPAGNNGNQHKLHATGEDTPASRPLFPHLAGNPLLAELFANTRDVSRSTTTRLFQNLCLGSDTFSQTYRIPAEREAASLLQSEDRPLLPPDLQAILLQYWQQDEIGLAAYTMRPSLPPREIAGPLPGYSPEAELALDLVGLASIPTIGYGRILYMANQWGEQPEAYLKPSPFQALAAILAALIRQELPALQAALHLYRPQDPPGPAKGSANLEPFRRQPVDIHVFEDSPGGIEAVQSAGQVLRTAGIPVTIHAWGISTHPEKVKQLEKTGAPVYWDTAEAIRAALQSRKL